MIEVFPFDNNIYDNEFGKFERKNTIKLWKQKEIKRLKQQLEETEALIKQSKMELLKIKNTRKVEFKDYGILMHKYGLSSINKALIDNYIKRINLLENNDISEKEYFSIMIL